MIELTPEQRQALDRQNGEPVRVVDPATSRAYVLLPAEDYDRLVGFVPPPSEDVSLLISPQMLRSQQAFWRDLPELLKSRRNRDKWVAYHGDERVGIDKSRTELYQRCFGRGLRPGEFYVGKIEPEETPPWVPTPMEESLYEFTDELFPPSPDP
jgi:hypothetical protein